jgi:hypothetical protein
VVSPIVRQTAEVDARPPVGIELVVTDLDGTLWHRAGDVHERTRRAITSLTGSSVPVLVATGRRVASTRAPLLELGISPPAVVLNGALGLDLATGERFHEAGFTPEDAIATLEVFRRHEIDPCVYVDHDDHAVCVSATPSTHPDHLESLRRDLVTRDLADVVAAARVLGFSVLGIPELAATTLGAALAAVATPHVDRDRHYGSYAVTAAPLTQSKWNGVIAFCARHAIDPSAILAIGDGPNDVELLENARIAVVPEDAHPLARSHADHVVGRAADGGWADIVDLIGAAPAP